MDKTCETCRWWKRLPARDLHKKYADDPRPEIRGLSDMLWWVWRPSSFKFPPSDIEFDILHEPNPTRGWCRRMPETIMKHATDYCGEHTPKDRP